MPQDQISKEIESKFGHRLRSRVNGILIEEDKILMVKHQMSENRVFWSVPGGGMKYGTSAPENLKREFLEETGLEIEIGPYLFVHEYLDPPLHAMEHFFEVRKLGGNLKLGIDPELDQNGQILLELTWMSTDQLKNLPKESLHQVFWGIKSLSDLGLWKGYFNFGNISIK
ncbi:ADP-ribose pyrophosphatase YjhB (NUDIX family) [Algoriphagus boseongensis]|uniref:ADP-ribose pyrophosphatase YjhB (NUDIX family) n=1 Tax=Algoriphagus boseongensis TaxID=1442587 RepID=A0A4R6TBA3_9BACT|nr:NUDIX domain-containing protein [Algoriphagus boseongensis]TDQ19523.1 ADP-ribose pyrophosphatase YjhB (NUDIX family) [Algoriphagus boseongensis]